MTVLINDNLQSYSPGNGLPNGFTNAGIVFTSEFLNFNTGNHPRPSPGFYERVGIGYQFFGNELQYPIPSMLSSSSVNSTSTFWASFGYIGFSLASVNPGNNDATTLLDFTLQPDYSLSINVPGATSVNSLQQVYFENTWQYWQVNAQFGTVGSLVSVIISLAVDGILIFDNLTLVSNVNVGTLWNGFPEINAWQWTGSNYFGEFTITEGLETIPYYPNEATTINMRMSQTVMEYARQNLVTNMRITQLVVENVRAHSQRNMRMTQAVVEIVLKGTFSQGGGFYVREA